MLTNIISVGCKPKDTEIAEKINELNGLVKNIIELGKHEQEKQAQEVERHEYF